MGTEVVDIKTQSPQKAVIFNDMEQILRGAELMANAKHMVPDHFIGNPGGCMAIIMQAQRWGMDPFVVASKTHIVQGRLGYEAQLVNAVVQSSGMINGSFRYEYRGSGASLECRVGAVLKGDQEVTWGEWLASADVKVKNSPLWKTNEKQQLGYLQCKNWARLYCPGAILGVYSADELREQPPIKDVTPAKEEPVSRSVALEQTLQEEIDEPVEELPRGALLSFAEVCQEINGAETEEQLGYALNTVGEFLQVEEHKQYRDEINDNFKARRRAIAEATQEA